MNSRIVKKTILDLLINIAIFFSFLIPVKICESILLYDDIRFSLDIWKTIFNSGEELILISIVFSIVFTFIRKGILKYIITALIALIIILEYLLSIYYTTNFILLDSVIYHHTVEELIYIFKSSGGVSYTIYLPLLIPLLLLITLKIFGKIAWYKYLLISITLLFATLSIFPKSKANDSVVSDFLTTKTVYFVNSTYKHFNSQTHESDEIIKKYWNQRPEFDYIENYNFPLLREYSLDTVFSNEFYLKETPPNIVFIMVEGLSRSLSGPNAYHTSFTPFLDSLRLNSLYWSHFVSNAERTFGVFPNCLGSLPFGTRGFMEEYNEGKYPKHNTLLKDLKNKLNYNTSFYYGGWSGFERLDKWLIYQETDKIIETLDFEKKYTKMTPNNEGFTWGFSDKDLLTELLIYQDSIEEPFFNTIQTLSMHEPYLFQGQEYYKKLAKEIILKNNLSEDKKISLLKNTSALSTVVFTDEQLKIYLEKAKTKPWFENTIFVIVGDHRIGSSIKQANLIDRYHVPLLIYSPLLKSPKELNGMCFHMDVNASLYSLFAVNYDVRMPKFVPWLGYQLNFTDSFYQNRFVPIMRLNREIDIAIDNDAIYYNNEAFKIDKNFNLTLLNDDGTIKSIEDKLLSFRTINNYVSKNDRIIH